MRLAQRQIWFVVASRATVLNKMIKDKDRQKSQRVLHAMLQMDKIDIPTLKKAYDRK